MHSNSIDFVRSPCDVMLHFSYSRTDGSQFDDDLYRIHFYTIHLDVLGLAPLANLACNLSISRSHLETAASRYDITTR